MAGRVEYEVLPEVCIGARLCGAAAPDHYAFDEEEAVSKATASPSEETEAVLDGAENCPVEAIVVRDADTGEQIFP